MRLNIRYTSLFVQLWKLFPPKSCNPLSLMARVCRNGQVSYNEALFESILSPSLGSDFNKLSTTDALSSLRWAEILVTSMSPSFSTAAIFWDLKIRFSDNDWLNSSVHNQLWVIRIKFCKFSCAHDETVGSEKVTLMIRNRKLCMW